MHTIQHNIVTALIRDTTVIIMADIHFIRHTIPMDIRLIRGIMEGHTIIGSRPLHIHG